MIDFKLSGKKLLLPALAAVVLGGCSNDLSDLHQFVQHAKATQKAKIAPLPEIKPHETFKYVATDPKNPGKMRRDPFVAFTTKTIDVIGKKGTGKKGKGPRPIEGRPKQLLEAFPLDSLRMVGILEQKGTRWALIKNSEGTIHRVKKGNYLGQNHGKILEITEDKVKLMEIVPDGLGDWTERPASLALIEPGSK
jgi:type IV pilus assembly protein PilP